MSRIDVLRQHIIKKAYAYKWDNVSLEDIVTSGYDVNKVSDENMKRALWQEGINHLKDMYEHTDFSKDAWKIKLTSLVKNSGMMDNNRADNLVETAVDNIFEYLNNMGWS